MPDPIHAYASWQDDAWQVGLRDIDGVVGQARRIADATEVARRLWARAHPDLSADTVAALQVELSTTLPAGMAECLQRAEELRTEALAKQTLAGSLVRQAAEDLCASGMTRTDIAAILGVSQQRASQLLAAEGDD